MQKIQRFIFRNKNYITIMSATLIIVAYALYPTGFYEKFNSIGNKLTYDILLIIASIIGVIPIAIQAYQALRVKVISIDVLVTIAVIGAFIIGEYAESAIVTFLFLFGAYLEQRTLNKTRSSIKELVDMAPMQALKKIDNDFVLVDIFEVNEGDTLLVRTGDQVPVDGVVIKGDGHINEASITGESMPVGKEVDSFVYAGTILENGTIHVKALKVGEDTTFGKIIELVEEAQDSKSEAERFIDKFSKYYTPAVLLVALLAGIITRDVSIFVTILVLGCPGALVIGVPVSNVSGIGNGAKHGVLLKGSETINDFSNLDVMIFDKTGTLTTGNMEVSFMKKYYKEENEYINYLLSIEKESDHPLAKAVVNHLKETKTYPVTNTNVVKGGGIIATVDNNKVIVGNVKLIEDENINLTNEMLKDIKTLEEEGNSLILTAINNKVQILIGIKDQIRKEVKEEIKRIKSFNVKELIVLSGDNQGTVDLVAKELGLTKAYGNMLPEDKANYIKELQNEGKIVAFVGDGVNDSPSLAIANIGIAMGSGTDVAIETSDVVLMNSDFSKLTHALGLTKKTSLNMKQNIVIAVGTVIILLSALIFSDWLTMSLGMLIHQGSILAVIFNGMRLINYKLRRRKN